MRLVLDTNVVASALLWNGPPRDLLRSGFREENQLFSSTPLLGELTEVLSRPKFALKVQASRLSVDELVDLYIAVVAVVVPVPVPRIAPDPDDDVVIGTALAANVDFVATGDKGLLSISAYQGTRIGSVREVLDTIRKNLSAGNAGCP